MYCGDRGRADKADRVDLRVSEDRVDRLLVAVDDIEDAGRQPRFQQQFGHALPGRGVALRRLQDEGVAAGQRHRKHPHRHHRRKVERGDPGAHADGLAQRPAVDAAADLLGDIAPHQMRDAAGELDDFGAALHLAFGIRQDLAVLVGDHPGKRVTVALHQFAELEEDTRAGQGRGRRPGGERRRRRLYRLVDLGGAAHCDAPGALAGRRVEHIAPAPARTPLALCLPLMKCWTSLMPFHPQAEFAQGRHHKPGAGAAGQEIFRARPGLQADDRGIGRIRRPDDQRRHSGPIDYRVHRALHASGRRSRWSASRPSHCDRAARPIWCPRAVRQVSTAPAKRGKIGPANR